MHMFHMCDTVLNLILRMQICNFNFDLTFMKHSVGSRLLERNNVSISIHAQVSRVNKNIQPHTMEYYMLAMIGHITHTCTRLVCMLCRRHPLFLSSSLDPTLCFIKVRSDTLECRYKRHTKICIEK